MRTGLLILLILTIIFVAGFLLGRGFLATDSGRYRAIGAVPVDVSDSVRALVIAERSSGTVDSMYAVIRVPHVEPPREAPLAVSTTFTRPLDAKTRARIARENSLAREVGKRSHERPPMWTREFRVPREAPVTSPFGTKRMRSARTAPTCTYRSTAALLTFVVRSDMRSVTRYAHRRTSPPSLMLCAVEIKSGTRLIIRVSRASRFAWIR